MAVTVLQVLIQDNGVEFVLDPGDGLRKGVARGISYFVSKESEEFGSRLGDLLREIEGFAEDLHYKYRLLPKGEQ